MSRIRSSLSLLAAIALGACSKSGSVLPASVPGGPANPLIDAATFVPSLQVDLNAMTKSASGLYYRDTQPGIAPAAVNGQQVSVKYAGFLADGTPFDSGTYPFQIGGRRVIPGWDEGIAGMGVGGKRQLVIPPDLGYGPQGSGKIPPNAILVFNVELVALQ